MHETSREAEPRIVYMGTAAFAVPALEHLCEAGYRPIAVVTGPDKPRGRGQQISVTPVKAAALRLGIDTLLQPERVSDPAFAEAVQALHPDIIVVVAFRILPPAVYTAARLGAFNLHGSLLPRYRGAAPIHRAVMAGDHETGVTTFFLEEKVDTGGMILQRTMAIGPDETTGEIHDRMMQLGAEVVLETVRRIANGTAIVVPQRNEEATAAPKVFTEDGVIDWSRPARQVHNHIRGLSPHPGAWTKHGDTLLKAYRSRIAAGDGSPGTVLEGGRRLVVACGEGAVELLDVQQEGKRRLPVQIFLNGYALAPGDVFHA
ncbi:MAG: methionyl-tRNA formyltransferase [Rhodothermales bacterium]|nr:methionyl-tRNA formyltransferase [Rhodothermales bacterium]